MYQGENTEALWSCAVFSLRLLGSFLKCKSRPFEKKQATTCTRNTKVTAAPFYESISVGLSSQTSPIFRILPCSRGFGRKHLSAKTKPQTETRPGIREQIINRRRGLIPNAKYQNPHLVKGSAAQVGEKRGGNVPMRTEWMSPTPSRQKRRRTSDKTPFSHHYYIIKRGHTRKMRGASGENPSLVSGARRTFRLLQMRRFDAVLQAVRSVFIHAVLTWKLLCGLTAVVPLCLPCPLQIVRVDLLEHIVTKISISIPFTLHFLLQTGD